LKDYAPRTFSLLSEILVLVLVFAFLFFQERHTILDRGSLPAHLSYSRRSSRTPRLLFSPPPFFYCGGVVGPNAKKGGDFPPDPPFLMPL